MTIERWRSRWEEGRIAFHSDEVHGDLRRWEARFLSGAQPPRRVLVPLCGKSRDLDWLARRGHDVVGVEFVEQAVIALFEESGRAPVRDELGGVSRWRDGALTVLQGDFFALAELPGLGVFDCVWDRAALVAVEPARRDAYVAVVLGLLRPGGRVLLNAFEYDQTRRSGPPWSVPDEEVRARFASRGVERLARVDAVAANHEIAAGHDYWWVSTYLVGGAAP
ncbi:MAG: methyltransferase domain-containing protein [Myxococcales bacterium]|nr:methyltransferase domain-containing protein [Myxococcales bacterium]MCB9754881.1 methyltransferase domain-containing protein [Myxococcales bacterium]